MGVRNVDKRGLRSALDREEHTKRNEHQTDEGS